MRGLALRAHPHHPYSSRGEALVGITEQTCFFGADWGEVGGVKVHDNRPGWQPLRQESAIYLKIWGEIANVKHGMNRWRAFGLKLLRTR